MDVLGTVAVYKLAGDRAVSDAVEYIRRSSFASLATSRQDMDARSSSFAAYGREGTHRNARSDRRRRRRRRSPPGHSGRSSVSSRDIATLTDDELERVLAERRHEKERYARAMKKDKLGRLERELEMLRRDIGRMDGVVDTSFVSGRRAHSPDLAPPLVPQVADQEQPRTGSLRPRNQARAPGVPPPPPPPPRSLATDDDDAEAGDADMGDSEDAKPANGTAAAEKRKKEKEERQRRREEKRKQRENAKPKLTIVDIIKGAGPDPMSILKPMTPKPADEEKEAWDRAKREREEREAQQEAQRIAQEKDAVERGASESKPAKDERENDKTDATDTKTDSSAAPTSASTQSDTAKTESTPEECPGDKPASGVASEAKKTDSPANSENPKNSPSASKEPEEPKSESSDSPPSGENASPSSPTDEAAGDERSERVDSKDKERTPAKAPGNDVADGKKATPASDRDSENIAPNSLTHSGSAPTPVEAS